MRVVISLCLVVSFMPVQVVRADVSICDTEISPHQVPPGSDASISFGIQNANDVDLQWIQLTRPAGSYFSLESASAGNWNASVGSNTITFTGDALTPGHSQGFFVQALAQNQNSPVVNWTIQVSGNADGSSAVTCGGDMSM